jgi:hypothetical protein
VENTIKEIRPVSIIPGLGEFPSEVARRFEKPRTTVQAEGDRRLPGHAPDGHTQERDTLDLELMHRLHRDMRTAVEEMRATQADLLAALSNLQMNLIRWILFTGMAVIVLLKLF